METHPLYMGCNVVVHPDGVTSHAQAMDAIIDTPDSCIINVHPAWYDELKRQNAIDFPKDPNVAALDKLHARVTKPPRDKIVVTSNPQPQQSFAYWLFMDS